MGTLLQTLSIVIRQIFVSFLRLGSAQQPKNVLVPSVSPIQSLCA